MNYKFYGYTTSEGYLGRLPDGKWQLFETEEEYRTAYLEEKGE